MLLPKLLLFALLRDDPHDDDERLEDVVRLEKVGVGRSSSEPTVGRGSHKDAAVEDWDIEETVSSA